MSKRKNRDNFVLPLCLGNTARHLQLLHPSAGELNYARRDIGGKGVLVNIPEFTWRRRQVHLMKGEREIRNSIDIGSFSIAMGFFLSK
jgi:hypothetical protein